MHIKATLLFASLLIISSCSTSDESLEQSIINPTPISEMVQGKETYKDLQFENYYPSLSTKDLSNVAIAGIEIQPDDQPSTPNGLLRIIHDLTPDSIIKAIQIKISDTKLAGQITSALQAKLGEPKEEKEEPYVTSDSIKIGYSGLLWEKDSTFYALDQTFTQGNEKNQEYEITLTLLSVSDFKTKEFLSKSGF